MQIVIDIHEKDYQAIKNRQIPSSVLDVIPISVLDVLMKGIPLPKGHGRLVDADALKEYIQIDADEWDEYALAYVKDAPTIIEADKEKSNAGI